MFTQQAMIKSQMGKGENTHGCMRFVVYNKASRYKASTYTDFTDTQFLIGSRKIQVALILSLFFKDTRFFTTSKIKIIEFSLLK